MFKRISRFKSVFIGMLVLAFLVAMPMDHALAALIETQAAYQSLGPEAARMRLLSMLARDEAKVILLQQGINPAEVEARIRAMTDEEIAQLNRMTAPLPAGSAGDIMMIGTIGLAVIVLLITMFFCLGILLGKIAERNQQEKALTSTPFPAPPRIAPALSVNASEPWTGKWKAAGGQLSGIWGLKQTGDKVVSTEASDYAVEAKVRGAMILGTWSEKVAGGKGKGDFKAIISDDGLSFNADAQYWPRVFFTANRVE